MQIPTTVVWSDLDQKQKNRFLKRPALNDSESLSQTVRAILSKVTIDGDEAVLSYTKNFDGAELDKLRLDEEFIDNASSEISTKVKHAIDVAYKNIRTFHEAQRPQDIKLETVSGVICEQKHCALEKVGLYIPGGTAPLPSTVLMLGVCAQVAQCSLPILCSPPNKKGMIGAEIRYAAKLCGIRHIYLCGGAQAIAAMAFGTQSIPKVDKIFGPGNSYVTEAKQQVSLSAEGAAIDMPAGPSEVLVIADSDANPEFIAADLLSQAEHGTDSQAVLVCSDAAVIKQVKNQIVAQTKLLSRKKIIEKSIVHSRFILTENVSESVLVSNQYAPEHLIVQTKDASELLNTLKNAGSIFIGDYSPESAGDYASGTNHVLPTYGYSRNYNSLGLLDFMRRYTVQELSFEGLSNIGSAIMDLADSEGLDAHRQAVKVRLSKGEISG